MKASSSKPQPSFRVELEPEEVEEALLAYVRRKRTSLPKNMKLPKVGDENTSVVLRLHGSQSNDDYDIGASTSVIIEW